MSIFTILRPGGISPREAAAAMPRREIGRSILSSTILLLLVCVTAGATTFTVTNTGDNAAAGSGSFRRALIDANSTGGATPGSPHVINFSAGVTGTISLGSALPNVSNHVTINGPGARVLNLARSSAALTPEFRVLAVNGGITVKISGLTISNGHLAAFGGGIYNSGTLTLTDCAISGNTATGFNSGGGIFNDGTLVATGTTISGNTCDFGAGIAAYNPGTVDLTNCTVSGNISPGTTGSVGGGILLGFAPVSVDLVNTTVVGNTSTGGGGIGMASGDATQTARYLNSIIANNSTTDIAIYSGTATSLGYNIVSDGTGNLTATGDMPNTDPMLGALANNGGPTNTHAPQPGSPAIDAGSAVAGLAYDQRGTPYARVQDLNAFANASGGDGSDIGSVETHRLVVNVTGDGGDVTAAGDGVADADGATAGDQTTLRAAIQESNARSDYNAIEFAIGTAGSVQTIPVSTSLPNIVQSLYIDGWSQGGAGYNGTPKIEIDGSATFFAFGLNLQAPNSTARGLSITNFPVAPSGNGIGIGIFGAGGTGIWIYGCHIGVDPSGMVDEGNGQGGIWIGNGPGGNLIGTNDDGVDDASERNIISGNTSFGILVHTPDNRIMGNYVGPAIDGTTGFSNGVGIAVYNGSGNEIGGTTSAARNVISGNDRGIMLNGSGVTGTTVTGNYVGTDAAGTGALPNVSIGVIIEFAADNSVVGGSTAGARNLISGNTGTGLVISGSANSVVQGNYIGTDVTGTAALSNGQGILIQAGSPNTLVGGSASGEGNVVSSNSFSQVNFIDGDNSRVQGNLIGTDAAGSTVLAGGGYGVIFQFNSTGNLLGTDANGTGDAGERNVIAGNTEGVLIIGAGTTGNSVAGNYIGTMADGATAAGNGNSGVHIGAGAADNTIGGISAAAANVIAYNGGGPAPTAKGGVLVPGAGNGNRIIGNSIHSNAGLGIDLGVAGVTANDLDDPDNGPNRLQNFPVISSAQYESSGDITMTYAVPSSSANSSYPLRIEIFASDGSREGRTLLATHTYATASAPATVTFTPSTPIAVGDELVATATDAAGNTSEFSAEVTVIPVILTQPVSLVRCAPDAATFSVVATGSGLTYRWRKDGSPLADGGAVSGATTATLTIDPTSAPAAGTYDVVVSGAISNPATLTVNISPAITQHPESITRCPGVPATFTAAASGTPAPTVQWQLDPAGPDGWSDIPGATSTSYTVASPTFAMNGDQYRAVFTNECSTATTDPATLTVSEPPTLSVTVTPTTLWPPNKSMHDITATVSTSGGCTPTSIVLESITSNENATNFYSDASFNTTPADVAFKLKADRNGNGSGRVYTITYKMTYDIGDNQTAVAYASATVTVPHDQGNKLTSPMAGIAGGMRLENNVPNPFEQSTEIGFWLPRAEKVTLKVYSITGEEVATLVDEVLDAGSHTLTWSAVAADGTPMPSGMYIYRIVSGSEVISREMVLRR